MNGPQVDGKTVLRFAKAYGFRNISTVVTRIKRGKCLHDFVEVMACPSGCVNGGGQVKPVQADGSALTPAQARDLLADVTVRRACPCPVPRSRGWGGQHCCVIPALGSRVMQTCKCSCA